ncbi:hypothetical protein O9929_16135 [Vibrio lentus]|nr:hypothetical protein [Vibrio lentus]
MLSTIALQMIEHLVLRLFIVRSGHSRGDGAEQLDTVTDEQCRNCIMYMCQRKTLEMPVV